MVRCRFAPQKWCFLSALIVVLSGCVTTSLPKGYGGPPTRPDYLNEYYATGRSYISYTHEAVRDEGKYTLSKITVETDHGQILIDYYARKKLNNDLIFVFPLLGGSNIVSDYFAEYFAAHGFDTAIVNRNDDFKRPENFDRLESLLRDSSIRDRIAMDLFTQRFGKQDFGSFGISRGAINVAITAGIDPRLKYNVMAMGGTDLANLFRHSSQRRIRRYTESVMTKKGMTEEQFFNALSQQVRTDPKYLASYIDARDTLMFLSVFDRTVPIKYGYELRDQIGDPRTVYLMADHYTSILYTGFLGPLPTKSPIVIFPFDFVEAEALEFYKKKFQSGHRDIRQIPFAILQMPFNLITEIVGKIF